MKDYIEKVMGVDPDDEPFLFETLDEAKLASIISTQQKVIAHQKKAKHQEMHAILIVLDDLASEQNFIATMAPSLSCTPEVDIFLFKPFAQARHGNY